ncbi:circadian clock protein KaiB [Pedobacter westerhofensis]|uniref:Circadian clock protein KaiB n=1 Tax=Pedobacter westerhofensis TaxID=425512 RepID=A0A521FJM8_9SPHI|nr:circadian clock KaiB family protein [Pedobacter westerhofensis]SMO96432.1 circadian clock protein KaiB [Pedobacter westerhofensis]
MDEDYKDWGIEDVPVYQLKLFVAGTSSLSVRAISNLKLILSKYLDGRYELDIIDVYQQPEMALQDDVAAVPMLLKKFPSPTRRLIGDMSDTAKVLRGLGI